MADGLGGYAGGAAASDFVLRTLTEIQIPSPDMLPDAMSFINQTLLNLAARTPELSRMSTTMTGVYFSDNKQYCVHIGNTRAYIMRENRLEQLTEDHTLFQRLMNRGMTLAAESCNWNTLTACFGGEPQL